jgi:hypothetical protein
LMVNVTIYTIHGSYGFGKWDEKWPLPVTFPVNPGRQPGPRPAVEAIGPSPAGHSRRARPSRSPGDVRGEQQEQQRYR